MLGEVTDNLRLVAPRGVRWHDGRFVLPDGRGDVRLTVGRTRDGVVARFEARPDGSGYDITVSERARTEDVARAVAHEMAEITLSHDPAVAHDTTSDRPTEMTDHLGGRFAEMRALTAHIDRATFDPARADDLPRLRKDLADLMRQTGMTDDPTAHVRRELLAAHDPPLARRLALEDRGLLRDHPRFGPSLSETAFDAAKAAHLRNLGDLLTGDHREDVRRAASLGLDGRMREEQARRVFDPVFSDDRGAAYKAARTARAVTPLFDALDKVGRPLNDPRLTPAEREQAMLRAVEGMQHSDALPAQVKAALDFDTMRERVRGLAAAPDRVAGVLDHASGEVTLRQGMPGHGPGERLPLRDVLHLLDRANRGAADNGLNVEFTAVIHDPVDGASHVEILPRPHPQYRLDAVGQRRRPPADAARLGAHTIDVGVGRSGYAVEMSPPADREHGGLVIQTELPDNVVTAQRRRDVGILDPGPLTGPGSVMVFGDMLFHGDVLAHGNDGVARVYINNVSAKLDPEDYEPLARGLAAAMADGGRVEVQWDTKPETPGGRPNDRGHIEGERLARQLHAMQGGTGWSVEHETTRFAPPGNADYDYSIDAGTRNQLDRDKMSGFVDPRPEYRTVITFHRPSPEPHGSARGVPETRVEGLNTGDRPPQVPGGRSAPAGAGGGVPHDVSRTGSVEPSAGVGGSPDTAGKRAHSPDAADVPGQRRQGEATSEGRMTGTRPPGGSGAPVGEDPGGGVDLHSQGGRQESRPSAGARSEGAGGRFGPARDGVHPGGRPGDPVSGGADAHPGVPGRERAGAAGHEGHRTGAGGGHGHDDRAAPAGYLSGEVHTVLHLKEGTNAISGSHILRDVRTAYVERYRSLIEPLGRRVAVLRFEAALTASPEWRARMEASRISAQQKVKNIGALGFHLDHQLLAADTSPGRFADILDALNSDPSVSGIIVQFPPPPELAPLVRRLAPAKDVDALLGSASPYPACATADGIARVVEPFVADDPLVAVVGSRGFVGRGVVHLLSGRGVRVMNLDLGDDLSQTLDADIVVSVTGKPGLLGVRSLSPDHRLVVDSGFVPQPDGGILSDVQVGATAIPRHITPVPGGIGPVEMAILMERLVRRDVAPALAPWRLVVPPPVPGG